MVGGWYHAGNVNYLGWHACHQRVTGRSQNVLIHLQLVNPKITHKNIDIFYIVPLSDLIPDLEASGCRDFEYVTSFAKFQILAEI